MLQGLVPAGVAAEEVFGDTTDGLLPAEEEVIRRAVERRRREFTTVRVCARRALAQLGVGPTPILPGPRGEPRWPAGIVGSLTHCDGYRAAAVATTTTATTIGIDAEPHVPLRAGVLDAIARAEEHEHLRALARAEPGVHYDRLLFSAKESVFKAWYPLTGRSLDFDEASVTFNPADRTFQARLFPGRTPDPTEIDPSWPTELAGRWTIEAGILLTAIVVLP